MNAFRGNARFAGVLFLEVFLGVYLLAKGFRPARVKVAARA
jgi:hypothetical protein